MASTRSAAAGCGVRPALLIEAGPSFDELARLRELPQAIRQNSRIRLLEARATLATGDLATVELILAERPVVADLQGDTALSDIWDEYHLRHVSTAENCIGTVP